MNSGGRAADLQLHWARPDHRGTAAFGAWNVGWIWYKGICQIRNRPGTGSQLGL